MTGTTTTNDNNNHATIQSVECFKCGTLSELHAVITFDDDNDEDFVTLCQSCFETALANRGSRCMCCQGELTT